MELRRRIDARLVERDQTMGTFIAETRRSSSLIYAMLQTPPRRQPSLRTAARLAQVLGCTVEDFTRTDETP